jgi:hypothetical protein
MKMKKKCDYFIKCNVNIIISLALREELRRRVFGNRASRIIFEPKREEVTGGCRK